MNDLSPRKQHSPLQVFVAFLATLAVGIGLLAAVAQAASSDDNNNAPGCSSDVYTNVSQAIDGASDLTDATAC
jgi:hypothetical protein